MSDGTPRPERCFLAHQDGTTSASFAPDGQTLATGGLDGVLTIWRL